MIKVPQDNGSGGIPPVATIGILAAVVLMAVVLLGIIWRSNQRILFARRKAAASMTLTPSPLPAIQGNEFLPAIMPASEFSPLPAIIQGNEFSPIPASYPPAYTPIPETQRPDISAWPQSTTPPLSPAPSFANVSSSDLNPLAVDFMHIMGANNPNTPAALNLSANSLLDTSPNIPEMLIQTTGPVNVQADPALRAAMQQAQKGIFVVPTREKAKQPTEER